MYTQESHYKKNCHIHPEPTPYVLTKMSKRATFPKADSTQFLLLAGCQAILGRSCKARYQFFGDGNEGRGEDHCIGTCFNFQPALA